jgi:hypothetical protein
MDVIERRPSDVINLSNLRTKVREFIMGLCDARILHVGTWKHPKVSIYCEGNRAAPSRLKPKPRQISVTQSRLMRGVVRTLIACAVKPDRGVHPFVALMPNDGSSRALIGERHVNVGEIVWSGVSA